MVHFLLVSLQSNPEKDTHLKHRHAHTHTNTSLTKHPPTKPPLFWPAVPLALAHGTSSRLQRHSDCVIFQLPSCWFGARWFRSRQQVHIRIQTSNPNQLEVCQNIGPELKVIGNHKHGSLTSDRVDWEKSQNFSFATKMVLPSSMKSRN